MLKQIDHLARWTYPAFVLLSVIGVAMVYSGNTGSALSWIVVVSFVVALPSIVVALVAPFRLLGTNEVLPIDVTGEQG